MRYLIARHLCVILSALLVAYVCPYGSPVFGQSTITKADNQDSLNQTTSWSGGIVPGVLDTALWDSTITGSNTVSLGANLSWRGVRITSPGGPVVISSGNTLTLGTSGIDMSTATQNLQVSSGLTLATGAQTWSVASGRTLTLVTGTFTRNAGATLNVQGAGTVAANMTGLTNTNGIVGTWATVGTGANTRFATLSVGNLVGYTGATLQSTAAAAWGGIASGGDGTLNHEITISGTPGQTGLGRNVNSIRYTGTGLVQQGNNTGILLNTNGILNAGTGTLSLATGGGSIYGITAGSTNELVLAAANANITIGAYIANNGVNTGRVTITGPQTVTLSGTNTFTGDLTINSGTLAAGTGQGAAPTASNLGALQPVANRNITINNGGTLSFTGGNVLGTGGSTNTLSNTTLVVNAGGLFRTGLDGSGTGWWNKIGATNLNGGTIRVGSGANAANFQGLALIGTVTVGGNSASSIENFAASNTAANGVHLGQNATAGQSITFNVADVTNSSASDLNVSTKLLNTSSDGVASGFTKTGAGTMTLSATSAYTGATVVSAGTLQIGNGTTDGNIASSSGITNNANLAFNLTGSHTYTNAVTGTGALTKAGAGSLTLSGANNYSGSTTLSGGTLNMRGTVGDVLVGNSTSNVLGNAANATLNMTSLTFAGGATLNLGLTSSSSFAVSGAINTTPANGSIVINASNSIWNTGDYSLISYGSLNGSLSNFSLGTIGGLSGRQLAGLVDTGSIIKLNISGDLPVWTGLGGNTWTTATSGDHSGANSWATKGGTSGTNFWAADTPEFNDTYNVGAGDVAVTNRIVDIQGANVSPGLVTFNNSNGDYTLSSSTGHGITGTASLLKSGTSALNISSINTYSGATTINAGTVNLSGSLSGTAINVASGAGLNVSSTGVISGTSTLTVNGTAVILGTSTYTGSTTIGTGGSIQIGNGTTDGSIATTSGITNNGSLTYNLVGNQTYGNSISGTGSLTKQGAGTLTLSTANSYQGGTTISGGAVTITGTGTLGGGNVNLASGTTLNINSGSYNTTVAVSGSGNIANTASHAVTGDFSGFNGTYTHTNTTVSTSFNSANATSANAAYVIASAQGSSQGMIAGGNGNYTLKMGSLSGVTNSLFRGGNSATGTTTLEVGSLNTNTTFAGSINNGTTKTIALTKVGTGTLTLTGASGYTGATVISGGTLQIGNGTIDGSLTGTSSITNNANLNYNLIGSQTYANVISGTGNLNKEGAGTLVLTGANTYSGSTTIQGGALQIGNGTTDGSIASSSSITNNGSLVYNLVGSRTYENAISGTGTLTKQGAGTLILSGSNTYTGSTTISGGVLQIGNGAVDGSIATTSSITNNGGLAFNLAGSGAYGNVIGGTGTLSKQGAGTLVLSGTNTYTGATTVSGGVLQIGNGTTDGSISTSSSITNNGSLVYNLNGSGAYGNVISGSGSLTKNGSGTLTLSGANTYQGATNVNGGTLNVTGSLNGTSGVNVASSATLNVGSSGLIAGSVSVDGTLTGTGSFSGDVTITGTHSVGDSPGLQSFTSLTYDNAEFKWELIDNTTLGRGINFDAIDGQAASTLTFTNSPTSSLVFDYAGSTVDWTDSFWSTSHTWSVFEGFTNIVGTPFAITSIGADSNSLAFGSGFTNGGSFDWSVSGGNVMLNYNVVAVPEPSSLVMFGLAGLGALLHRRRKRKRVVEVSCQRQNMF